VRPLHSGQLAKKTRSLFAGWQSRFCVLVGVRGAPSVTLRYWDSERAHQKDPHLARGEICMRVDPCNVLAHKVAGPVPTMQLQLPGRTWQFRGSEATAPWHCARKGPGAAQARTRAHTHIHTHTHTPSVSLGARRASWGKPVFHTIFPWLFVTSFPARRK